MLRRTALIVATVLTAVVGAARGAVFVNPVVALPGFPLSCSQLVDSGQQFPAAAGSATGRAIVAALAPDCSVAAALRSTGTAFGPPQTIGGQLSAGTEAIDVPKALVNARGDAVVAWSTQNGCALAFAPAGSDAFGPAEPPTFLDGAACPSRLTERAASSRPVMAASSIATRAADTDRRPIRSQPAHE